MLQPDPCFRFPGGQLNTDSDLLPGHNTGFRIKSICFGQAVAQALQLDHDAKVELEPEEETYVKDLLEQHMELVQVSV